MPTKCCVPFCKSNYDSQKETVSMFGFPLDPDRRQLWIDSIAREDLKNPSKYQGVCVKHFCERFIIRIDSIPLSDGSVFTAKRQHPTLTKDAYPSLFPERPSESQPKKKRAGKERRPKEKQPLHLDVNAHRGESRSIPRSTSKSKSIPRSNVRSRSKLCLKPTSERCIHDKDDKISNFFDFMAKFYEKKTDQWINKFHMKDKAVQYLSFYCILDTCRPTFGESEHIEQEGPSLLSSIRIFNDMNIQVYTKDGGRVPFNKLKRIFREQTRPVLKRWSQFEALLLQFSACKDENEDEMTQDEICAAAEGSISEPQLPLSKSLFMPGPR